MKDIKGFEGLYAVTALGQVWSYKKEKFLKPYYSGNGYLKVSLYKDKVRKQAYVHTLVAEAYVPNDNPEEKTQVNHKSEIKTENFADNLEWTTPKENSNYGTRTERVASKKRKPVYCVELDRVFQSMTAAAAELGLRVGGISNCLKGRTRTCGGYHWERVENI